MKWNHILDKEPEDNTQIIQIHPRESDGHYCMGMRRYNRHCSTEEFNAWCKKENLPLPDFRWIYAKDFQFPDKPEETPAPVEIGCQCTAININDLAEWARQSINNPQITSERKPEIMHRCEKIRSEHPCATFDCDLEDNKLILGVNGEYSIEVNFCPFCGWSPEMVSEKTPATNEECYRTAIDDPLLCAKCDKRASYIVQGEDSMIGLCSEHRPCPLLQGELKERPAVLPDSWDMTKKDKKE